MGRFDAAKASLWEQIKRSREIIWEHRRGVRTFVNNSETTGRRVKDHKGKIWQSIRLLRAYRDREND
jgi:hypothetical protein